MLFGIVFVQIVFAQSAWLSADESVNTFRSQVESAKPAISKYPQINTAEFQIPLKGRQITVRVYDSGDNNPKPTIVYVHGGCWVAGSLDSHDEISRYLAAESGAKVIAIGYRIAPEHPYPSAHAHMNAGVGHDVVSWISVEGNLAAHQKAIRFIKSRI